MRKLILLAAVAFAPMVATQAHATVCSASDLSLSITSSNYSPASCADNVDPSFAGNDAANMNTALGTTGFAYLDSTSGSSAVINGLKFTVTAHNIPNSNRGTWTVDWDDMNGATPANFPIKMDLEVGLFNYGFFGIGADGAAYLMTNVLFPLNPDHGHGSFEINFNPYGDWAQPDLSRLTLLGKVVQDPVAVPEPMTAALFGAGLLGLGLVRRKRA